MGLDLPPPSGPSVKTLKKRDRVQRDVAADFGKIFCCPQDLGDTREMSTPSKDVLISNLQNFWKKLGIQWCETFYL